MANQTYDPEKFQLDIARLRAGGEVFEIVVNPDAAIAFREGKMTDVAQVLKSVHVFADAQKGLHASAHHFPIVFKTEDPLEVARVILQKGEMQLTSKYKDQIREQKLKQILAIIAKNAVDPTTDSPHPLARLESAFAQSKIKIDEFKTADDQIHGVLAQLRLVLPIKFEEKEIEILLTKDYASKVQKLLKTYGTLVHNEWLSDGSFRGIILIPGGVESDMYAKLQSLTHGTVKSKVLSTK